LSNAIVAYFDYDLQDFAVIDLSHTQPDNLQCIWCGMFIDATTIAVHFTDCHPGEVEVPKCLLCIQELVINARVIEKFGSDFDIVLQDEFHIKVGKLNKLFTSESQMDTARLDRISDGCMEFVHPMMLDYVAIERRAQHYVWTMIPIFRDDVEILTCKEIMMLIS
ncbi:hypothetical protein ANCDUO_03608, partial [Ancylostoma duodenale]